MRQAAGMQKYMTNHYEGMSPEQLILMLYKGALFRLQLVKQGIEEKNIQKRGENLSKVIAIISELNASIRPDMNDENTNFLRGLYSAMLKELVKVSVTNDVEIVNRTERYMLKLKDIWENDVMGKKSASSSQPYPQKAAATASVQEKRSFLGIFNNNDNYNVNHAKSHVFAV